MVELTRRFAETIVARAGREPAFREALLAEAVDCLISGELAVGKALMRDVAEATIGIRELSTILDTSPKSLEQMLSPTGNPTAARLLAVVKALQVTTGVKLGVTIAAAE